MISEITVHKNTRDVFQENTISVFLNFTFDCHFFVIDCEIYQQFSSRAKLVRFDSI